MWTREEYDRAKALRNNGHTHREIGIELGYTHVQIRKMFSREWERERRLEAAGKREFPNNGRAWTENDAAQAIKMLREGISIVEISAALGRSPNGVCCFLHKKGLSVRQKEPVVKRRLQSYELAKVRGDALAGMTAQEANVYFLIDLIRASGFKTLGDAKAAYIAKNELTIQEGSTQAVPVSWFVGSAIGSSADMCAV